MKAYSTQRLGPSTSWGDAPEPMDTGKNGVRIEDETSRLKVTITEKNGWLTVSVDPLRADDGRRLVTDSTIHSVQARMVVQLDG